MDANPQSINSTEDIKLILSSFYNKIISLTEELESTRINHSQSKEQFKKNQGAFEMEIDKIKQQLLEYQSIIALQSSKIALLENELSVIKHPHNMEIEGLSTINTKTIEENINLMIEIKSFEVQLKKANANNLQEIINDFDSFRTNINNVVNHKNQEIDSLTKENKELEKQNKELRNKVLDNEREINSKKFCTHCHDDFIPKFNDDVN